MIINSNILSLPPHLSLAWRSVECLHVRDKNLYITLASGATVTIENLSSETISAIFKGHASHLKMASDKEISPPKPPPYSPFAAASNQMAASTHTETSFQLGMTALDGLGSAMQHLQHNAQFANSPDLPKEMLEKIRSIAHIIIPNDLSNLPRPEPHCNCPHCQIARVICLQAPQEEPNESEEDLVATEELSFQQWRIQQTAPQLFQVTNQLDPNETYQVHLGDPIGCTCGQPGCEHIPAVLKS